MKKYLTGVIAILIAFTTSAYTRACKKFSLYRFQLKVGIDLTSASAVENKVNWEQSGTLVCSSADDLPCSIAVSDAYSHYDASIDEQVLNNIYDAPIGEGWITISTANGYLDAQSNPDVQYKKISPGLNYTYTNKSF